VNEVLIAPFTNSAIRDWPVEHYTALVGLLLDGLGDDIRVRIVGTPGQRLRACAIVRPYSNERASNDCGRLGWPALLTALRSASCVIGNNSGIGHLSGSFGTPTVSVFGGSHERREWRPRGDNVVLLTRAIGCSPCQLDHGDTSPYNKACLRQIEPVSVFEAAVRIMERAAAADRAGGEDV
jgi:ADP-heptose:LPS heptosyltransferase